ncbi:MAG: hypothetical protein MUE44_04770 [Oscillatoriaceae cyanobacterium Prado104]|jgi:hypothetical protein|nr:hypothetical protein [Oscillatoriaceae cyanobacterium Prado104]
MIFKNSISIGMLWAMSPASCDEKEIIVGAKRQGFWHTRIEGNTGLKPDS